MELLPFFLLPLFFYPFALQYLRTGEINRYQLVVMAGVIVAMGPRLLVFWTNIEMPKLFQDGWLLLWIVGLAIWLFPHRAECWPSEFSWAQQPTTLAERLAATVAVLMIVGYIILVIVY